MAWRSRVKVSATAAAPMTPVESTMAITFLGNRPACTARSTVDRSTRSSALLTMSRAVVERHLVRLRARARFQSRSLAARRAASRSLTSSRTCSSTAFISSDGGIDGRPMPAE